MSSLSSLSDAQLAAIAGEIDPDTDALVRTVWGEARNQGPEGRKAVAAVIRNRANLTGRPISAVVREPGQFEPWNDARVRPQLEGLDPASDAYLSILADVEAGDDPTGGATHFYAPKAQAALGRRAPAWDDGSGVDIGDHRFFRLSYGDQPVPESETAPPPLEEMSDEELEAIAAGQEPAAAEARPSVDVGDVQFVDQPKTGLNPKAPFVYADDENPLTPDQVTTYERLIQSGKIDPESVRSGAARSGSEANPKAQRDPNDIPKPGDWYIDAKGKLLQVPEVPMLDTVVNMGRYLSNPVAANFEMDPRSEAMRRALESGVMLGGRNELVSGIEAIKRLALEGVPLKEGFGEALAREDVSSARARRDFPIAYDASAVTGALASGAALPSGLGARVATGAGSGFLATDGGLKERAVGAGVGVLAGEALGAVAPRIAGRVIDMTGVPTRQPGAQPQISPLTGLPMDDAVSRGEMRAAEVIRRNLDRDMGGIQSADLDAMPFQRGDNMTALAEVVAQSPGSGQAIVRKKVADQAGGATGRIKSEIATTLGGTGDYFEKLAASKVARKAEADKTMADIGGQEVRLDTDSVQALRSDLARGAIREQALNALASPDASVRDAGARLNRLYDDLLDKPGSQTITVRDAQNISRSLLDAADDAYRAGNGSRGAALKGLGKAIRENAATPERGGFSEYGGWLKRYAEDSDAIDALETGRNVFAPKLDMSVEQLRKSYAGWSDAAKENYRIGVGEAVLDATRRKGGVAEARQLLKNEEFADRIRLAVPDSMSFDSFMGALEREVERAARNNRVVGGSPTYARAAARADVEAQGRDPLDVAAEGVDLVLSPGKALTGKALKEALKAIPRKDRSVIGDPAANAALAKALTDDAEMTRLLNLLQTYKARREIPMLRNQGIPGGYAGALTASERR